MLSSVGTRYLTLAPGPMSVVAPLTSWADIRKSESDAERFRPRIARMFAPLLRAFRCSETLMSS